METQRPYNVYLDYKGYMIEPTTYRVSPAPLMGTKFTTGRSAYSDMDFWQVGAMTDFSKGMNQKFMVDPSMCMRSIGLDLAKPGELKLERDTETFSGTWPGSAGKVTAHYRRLNDIYLGDDAGNIIKSTDGDTFTIKYTITDTHKKIYNFYEIDGILFCTTGPGNIYSDPDGTDNWTRVATATRFPRINDDGTPTASNGIRSVLKVAQSFRVSMGGDTFNTLKLKLKKNGTPPNNLTVNIYQESISAPGEPGELVPDTTFTFDKSSVTTNYAWITVTISNFSLASGKTYFLQAETVGGDTGNGYFWGYEKGHKATYDSGNAVNYDGSAWIDRPDWNQYFILERETITDLYYTMVESDYGFGWFNDGIRRSVDGYNWIPEPPDPLWVMPTGEGTVLNAVSIPKSFIAGSKRGLWAFVGGSSGLNVWTFPDYADDNNFKGLERWGHMALFSVENQGIYYTDGSQVLPTMMTYLEEGFTFANCAFILSSGWDVYAAVSDNGTDWYLARANMTYNSQPKYWWLVKKLKGKPAHMAGWSATQVMIFYEDKSIEVLNKISGPYVSSGNMITSILDENLVKILKMYNNLSMIYSSFPGDGTAANSTNARLSYLKDNDQNYINSEIFYGNGRDVESVFDLPNPTLGNKIQIKLTLGCPAADRTITPIVTDLMWKYILQQPSENTKVMKNFTFTVFAEDHLEDYTGDFVGPDVKRQHDDIMVSLWESAAKKQILNYIGADNKSEIAIEVNYDGAEDSAYLTIDRTNYTMTYRLQQDDKFTANANIGGGINDYSYRDKTLDDVVLELNTLWPDFTFTLHRDQDGSRSANDLEPRENLLLAKDNSTYLMAGSDVHAVIISTQSPSQQKQQLDGRGSDRLQVSLREA